MINKKKSGELIVISGTTCAGKATVINELIKRNNNLSLVISYTSRALRKGEVNGVDYKGYKPYYLIITDDYKTVRDTEILKDVQEMPINFGFSLVVISPRLINIPNECKTFISIGDKKSGVFENELVSNKQKEFEADFDPTLNMYECCKIIANIPIDIAKESRALPTSVSFLEMYNVGMVEQLNVLKQYETDNH